MYTLRCIDPRDRLGVPELRSTDLAALQGLCDRQNAVALREDGFEQYWIVAGGRVVQPPAFVDPAERTPRLTPWGPALSQVEVQPGVTWLVTGCHRGYHLTSEVNARIPQQVRRAGGYYERDFEAALCAYFVPLRGAPPADVLAVIETQYPELYVQLVNGRVQAPSGGPL